MFPDIEAVLTNTLTHCSEFVIKDSKLVDYVLSCALDYFPASTTRLISSVSVLYLCQHMALSRRPELSRVSARAGNSNARKRSKRCA